MEYAYIKNKFVKKSKAFLSINERGFKFGDGFFDTIIIDNFQPYQWQYHKNKLNNNLSYLKLNVSVEHLEEIAKKIIAKNQFRSGLLRISISRGIGSQGYKPSTKSSPSIVIETIKSKNFTKNANLWLSSYKKIPRSCINPNIKLMSGVQNVLCRMEALEHDCCEALLLDMQQNICEGSSSNIFWIKNKQIYTSASTLPIYEGSIRKAILNLFPNTQEVIASLTTLYKADEIFVTNCAWKIKSICKIENISSKTYLTTETEKIKKKLVQNIKEKTRQFNAWQL